MFEFPEMTGHNRRDYWLALIKEIVAVHKFSRTYKLEGLGKSEALARAVLGIARMRAVREVFKVLPPGADCLLTFCYGDIMPHGDLVMAALADTLRHSGHGEGGDTFLDRHEGNKIFASSATASVASLGPEFTPHPTPEQEEPGASAPINEVEVGGETKLEKTIKDSWANTEKVEEAQATVDTVKVDGIGTNVQVLTVCNLFLLSLILAGVFLQVVVMARGSLIMVACFQSILRLMILLSVTFVYCK